MAVHWRDARPPVTLVSEMDRGQRSYRDPQSGALRFGWGELAHLPPKLLRAALAHELAHTVSAIRGAPPGDEGAAMRVSSEWGYISLPR